MKTGTGIAACVLLAGTAGCTGMQERSAHVTPHAVQGIAAGQATTTAGNARTTAESRYVARVNALARKRGVQMIWVNPPVPREVASR